MSDIDNYCGDYLFHYFPYDAYPFLHFQEIFLAGILQAALNVVAMVVNIIALAIILLKKDSSSSPKSGFLKSRFHQGDDFNLYLCMLFCLQVVANAGWLTDALWNMSELVSGVDDAVHVFFYPMNAATNAGIVYSTLALLLHRYASQHSSKENDDIEDGAFFLKKSFSRLLRRPAGVVGMVLAVSLFFGVLSGFMVRLDDDGVLNVTSFERTSSYPLARSVVTMLFVSLVPYLALLAIHVRMAKQTPENERRIQPRIHKTRCGKIYSKCQQPSNVTAITNDVTANDDVTSSVSNDSGGPETDVIAAAVVNETARGDQNGEVEMTVIANDVTPITNDVTNVANDVESATQDTVQTSGLFEPNEKTAITFGFLWAFHVCYLPMLILTVLGTVAHSLTCGPESFWAPLQIFTHTTAFFLVVYTLVGPGLCLTLSTTFRSKLYCQTE